ncbi:MAG TPA: hypothetical protein VN881_02745, partial [Candidatus Acidoferrales bacterium]|nr:hypothetical protein [Candidatus Acidoferrales bacterium]
MNSSGIHEKRVAATLWNLGNAHSGRSPATTGTYETRMLSGPYGSVVRRGASGRRKREQAPALHRNVAALDLECGASALRLL